MITNGDVTPIVEGRKVYALAVTAMPQVTLEVLEPHFDRVEAQLGVEPTPERGGQAPTATSLDASLLLAAPDVAMTEAAIGSGLTTFLFFFVLGRVRRGEHD